MQKGKAVGPSLLLFVSEVEPPKPRGGRIAGRRTPLCHSPLPLALTPEAPERSASAGSLLRRSQCVANCRYDTPDLGSTLAGAKESDSKSQNLFAGSANELARHLGALRPLAN